MKNIRISNNFLSFDREKGNAEMLKIIGEYKHQTFENPKTYMEEKRTVVFLNEKVINALLDNKIITDEANRERLINVKNSLVEYNENQFIKYNKEINYSSFDGKLELREYQKKDIDFLITLKKGLNFSEQRTGKTPTALLLCKNLNKKTLIVCPSSLILNTWLPEAKKWLGIEAKIMFRHTKKSMVQLGPGERMEQYDLFFQNKEFDILIISKDTWKKDFYSLKSKLENGDFNLIVDEAHYLKGLKNDEKRSTLQSIVTFETSKIADRSYLLTGTPIVNYPYDLFGIFKFINPVLFTNYYKFIEYYFGFSEYFKPNTSFKDYKDEKKFIDNLLKPYSVMHKQKDVIKWLPEIQYEEVRLYMHPRQETKYWGIHDEVTYGKSPDDTTYILGLIQQMAPVSNGVMIEDKYISNKFEWLVDFLDEYKDYDEKILIVSNYSNKTLKLLKERIDYYNPQLITGETSQVKRKKIIDLIQTGDSRILISNIKCIKEGITLDKIDILIFVDRSWSPAENEQALMRFMPPEISKLRSKNKQVIDLISCPNETRSRIALFNRIDDYILETLETKKDISKNINFFNELSEE